MPIYIDSTELRRVLNRMPAAQNIKLDLQISGRDNSNKWNAHSSVSNKYTKTDVNKLFSSMMAQ